MKQTTHRHTTPDVIDPNAHARIDLLARCMRDFNTQIEKIEALEKKVARLQEVLKRVYSVLPPDY